MFEGVCVSEWIYMNAHTCVVHMCMCEPMCVCPGWEVKEEERHRDQL
jgi:hypothetical protein